MEKIIYTNSMNTRDLKNLTKSQLIRLLIKQNLEIKKLLYDTKQQLETQKSKDNKPIPTPRKSVKQMVQDYEDNIIPPQLEFRDDYKPIPKPRSFDSFQFMSSSLEKLVSNLPRKSLKYTSQRFKDAKLDLMVRKGVYPYDYMDSFDKFNDKLPIKEEFYSILNDEHISDEDYENAQDVWNTFSLKNMGEYHDLYLQSDILLLADVFENFRKTCLEII